MTEPFSEPLVVDTSAAVAVILAERGSDWLLVALDEAPARFMSAASKLELGLVVEARLGAGGSDVVVRFLRDARIEVVDVAEADADRALEAWRRYGKGRHRAALNYGDCFVYALAERMGVPVLCTGEDFAGTDLPVRRPTGAP